MSKKPVSDDRWTSNIVNVHKHCWNLHRSTFIIFIGCWERNCVRKSLSYWHAKTSDCLLTLAADEKCLVLHRDNLTIPIQMELAQKQKNFFSIFCSLFEIYMKFEKFWMKRWPSPLFYFRNLRTLKTWIDNCLKSLVSEDPSTRNMVIVPKHCWNLHQSTFIIFIGHWQRNCVWESLSYTQAKSWECLLNNWLAMKSILFLIEII